MKYILVIVSLLIVSGCAVFGGDEPPPLSERLKGAGLQVEALQDLGNNELPPGASSGQNFFIPAHCDGCGGKILIFGNETDAGRMADAWRGMGQHVYTKGGTLLQINGSIAPDVAQKYGNVLLE